MIKIQHIVLLLVAFLSVQTVVAQSPKREFRATWLTTVWRLDWPNVTVPVATGSNETERQAAIQQQKNGLISILNSLKAANMNAVFFQVRSMSDALYPSSYEPWSSFISSVRGADPGYDPLAFAIEEAHKRGIELHAWINPYRYSSSSATHGELSTDYSKTHPEWLMSSSANEYVKILNPGVPEVIQRISDIVAEVVTKYDVDGIVFDDYFYINGGTTNASDQTQFSLYNPDNLSRADWRRQNVNKMVKSVYNTIQSIKPEVTFGISPAGVAASSQTVADKYGVTRAPVGSDWQYDGIYSDPLAWLKEGTIDYISPQIYWTVGSGNDYAQLCAWWSVVANRFGKHFYSSHSVSDLTAAASAPTSQLIKIGDDATNQNALSMLERNIVNYTTSTEAAKAPSATNFVSSEIGLQVSLNRSNDINNAPGSVFYSTAKTVNTAGFIDYLKGSVFTNPALVPSIGWKTVLTQTLVDNLMLLNQTLSWTYSTNDVEFAVYAVPNANRNDAAVFTSSKYLLGTSYNKTFELPSSVSSSTHKIGVSVVDKYGNEYSVRVLNENLSTNTATELISPVADVHTLFPCLFKWSSVENADGYVWQLSRNQEFTDIICSRETTEPQFFSGLQTNIQDNVDYYWRVLTKKTNATAVWSTVRKMSGHKFKVISPTNGSNLVSLTPTIEWDNVSNNATYTLEISTASDFNISKQVYKQTIQTSLLTIPSDVLLSSTTYYMRVSVVDGIVQATSETVSFKTQDAFVPVPQIISPQTGTSLFGRSIEVCWSEQTSKGFRVELSKDPLFPARSTTIKSVSAYTYCATYENLSAATYYIRLKAINSIGLTEPSPVISVVLSEGTGLNDTSLSGVYCYLKISGQSEKKLVVNSNSDFSGIVRVFSISGIEILNTKIEMTNGDNFIDLNTNNLVPGVFTVLIQNNNDMSAYKVIF